MQLPLIQIYCSNMQPSPQKTIAASLSIHQHGQPPPSLSTDIYSLFLAIPLYLDWNRHPGYWLAGLFQSPNPYITSPRHSFGYPHILSVWWIPYPCSIPPTLSTRSDSNRKMANTPAHMYVGVSNTPGSPAIFPMLSMYVGFPWQAYWTIVQTQTMPTRPRKWK